LKRLWKAGLGLAVSALCLWWAFRGVDLGAIGRYVASADPLLLALAGGIATAGGLIRAARWKLLLAPTGIPTSFNSRWKALNIGFMVTNIALGRLGEVARPFALSRLTPVSMSAALGTVVLERVLDTVALLLLLLVTLLTPSFPDGGTVLGLPMRFAVLGVVGLAVAGLSLIGVFLVWPNAVFRFAKPLAHRLPGKARAKFIDGLQAFATGLDLVRRPGALFLALLWSIFLWVWMAASFWVGFKAFGIDAGFLAAVFTQCVVSVFVAIPAGPGFIGTLQVGVSVGLHEVFGVPSEPVLSLAVGYHVAGFIPVTLLGLFYAWTLGLHLGSTYSDTDGAMEGADEREAGGEARN
jgi:uncharacterized protein (TIRG00374 family)